MTYSYTTLWDVTKGTMSWGDFHDPAWVLLAGLELDYGSNYTKMQELAEDLNKNFHGRLGDTITVDSFEGSLAKVYRNEVKDLIEDLRDSIELR